MENGDVYVGKVGGRPRGPDRTAGLAFDAYFYKKKGNKGTKYIGYRDRRKRRNRRRIDEEEEEDSRGRGGGLMRKRRRIDEEED